jgi:hypothetical protein
MLLYVFAILFAGGAFFAYFAFGAARRLRNWQQSGRPQENRQAKIQRISKYYFVISTPFLLVCLAALFIQIAAANQAVLIRRIYEADRDILAPQLTSVQLAQLQAQFCSMRGKNDFSKLMNKMLSLAEEKNIELRPDRL